MKFKEREGDYDKVRDIVEDMLYSLSRNWVKRLVLSFVVRDHVSLDRSANGERMPWSTPIKINEIGFVALFMCVIAPIIGLLVSLSSYFVFGEPLLIFLAVTCVPLAPLLVLGSYYWRLRLSDPRTYELDLSYQIMAKHLAGRVRKPDVKAMIALMARKDHKHLTALDFIRVAAHLSDAHEQREIEKLEAEFKDQFIEGENSEAQANVDKPSQEKNHD